jgi:hypothetical protein
MTEIDFKGYREDLALVKMVRGRGLKPELWMAVVFNPDGCEGKGQWVEVVGYDLVADMEAMTVAGVTDVFQWEARREYCIDYGTKEFDEVLEIYTSNWFNGWQLFENPTEMLLREAWMAQFYDDVPRPILELAKSVYMLGDFSVFSDRSQERGTCDEDFIGENLWIDSWEYFEHEPYPASYYSEEEMINVQELVVGWLCCNPDMRQWIALDVDEEGTEDFLQVSEELPLAIYRKYSIDITGFDWHHPYNWADGKIEAAV